MRPLFNERRVQVAAECIAKELIAEFDPDNIDGRINSRMRECPAYKDGLTLGESAFAALRAMSMVQIEVSRKLGAKWIESVHDFND